MDVIRESQDLACAKHGFGALPDGCDECPVCRLERQRDDMLVERATRHHPKSVDDCADISAYRR